jgi:hypothetical protein
MRMGCDTRVGSVAASTMSQGGDNLGTKLTPIIDSKCVGILKPPALVGA